MKDAEHLLAQTGLELNGFQDKRWHFNYIADEISDACDFNNHAKDKQIFINIYDVIKKCAGLSWNEKSIAMIDVVNILICPVEIESHLINDSHHIAPILKIEKWVNENKINAHVKLECIDGAIASIQDKFQITTAPVDEDTLSKLQFYYKDGLVTDTIIKLAMANFNQKERRKSDKSKQISFSVSPFLKAKLEKLAAEYDVPAVRVIELLITCEFDERIYLNRLAAKERAYREITAIEPKEDDPTFQEEEPGQAIADQAVETSRAVQNTTKAQENSSKDKVQK